MQVKYFSRSVTLLFLAVATILTGCSAREGVPVGQIPAFQAPTKQEAETVKMAVAQGLKEEGHSISTSGPEYQRARRIIDRLSSAAGSGSFQFPLIIADAGEDVNAMVADGKTVVVYKELMTRVPSDDELATVLAHEVGHVLGKHHEDNGTQERTNEVAVGGAILGTVADVALTAVGFSALGTVVGNVTEGTVNMVGMGAYALAYDRDMEYEADHIGMMLMAKAGYDPSAAIRFWANSDEIFGGSNSLSFFSTHPSNSDRLDALNEYLPIAQQYYTQRQPMAQAQVAVNQKSKRKKKDS
jgi:predicted Zn-dependent protease